MRYLTPLLLVLLLQCSPAIAGNYDAAILKIEVKVPPVIEIDDYYTHLDVFINIKGKIVAVNDNDFDVGLYFGNEYFDLYPQSRTVVKKFLYIDEQIPYTPVYDKAPEDYEVLDIYFEFEYGD